MPMLVQYYTILPILAQYEFNRVRVRVGLGLRKSKTLISCQVYSPGLGLGFKGGVGWYAPRVMGESTCQ